MNNYSNFIDSLITGTKNKTIIWDYLDTRSDLYEKFVDNSEDFYTDDSFYAPYNDSYFVLISTKEEITSGKFDKYGEYILPTYVDVIKLAVIPSTFRDIKVISGADNKNYSSALIRLRNLIKKDFPNSDDIIEQFISENPTLPF